jgi:DNA-directed RNA polymerase II subunit RPB1
MSQLPVYTVHEHVPATIQHVEACVLSPEEIRRRSVCRIIEPLVYEKNMPKGGGVNDHRLGVVDRRFRCGTCGAIVGECIGHEGHIELPWPVYHAAHIERVMRILRLVCFSCSRLLFLTEDSASSPSLPVDDEEEEETRTMAPSSHDDNSKVNRMLARTQQKERLSSLASLVKKTTSKKGSDANKIAFCPHCQLPQPHYTRDGTIVRCDWKQVLHRLDEDARRQVQWRPFTAADARDILQNISDADCRCLGLDPSRTRPEYFIQTNMVVSSPVIRPTIAQSSGARNKGLDDLTKMTICVVKAVRAICRWQHEQYRLQSGYNQDNGDDVHIWPPPFYADRYPETLPFSTWSHQQPPREDLLEELQTSVSALINNDVRGAKQAMQRSGAPRKSIQARFKGKEGRVRGNVMGKRVNFSGRNVITPDACIDANELGVSGETMSNSIFPDRVCQYNYAVLQHCVRLGADHPLGALAVATPERNIIYLEALEDGTLRDNLATRMTIGWTVYRYLRDGDLVIFNRQPSLHRGSMLSFRAVRREKQLTTGLNLANTTIYNADFDGDEMNIHLPISHPTRAEARVLMANENHMITPQSHTAIIALVQDALVGTFLMTRQDVFLTRPEVMQLLMSLRYPIHQGLPVPAILRPKELWTGKQVFSLLISPRITLCRQVRQLSQNDPLDHHERYVCVEDGELLCGSLCKETVGGTRGSLVLLMWRDVSHDAAMNFVSDAKRLVNAWIHSRGLSLGVEDVISPERLTQRVDALMDHVVQHIDNKLIPLAAQPNALAGHRPMDVEQAVVRLQNNAMNLVTNYVQQEHRVTQLRNALDITSVAKSKGGFFNKTQIVGCVGPQNIEGRLIQPDIYSDRPLPSFRRGERGARAMGFICNNFSRGLSPSEQYFHAMTGRESLAHMAVKTSKIGYMQRKISKAMESEKVEYDYTARNADHCIIEFSYGYDHIDPTMCEFVEMAPYMACTNKTLLQKTTCHQHGQCEYGQRCYERILACRERLKEARLYASKREGKRWETKLLLPLNPSRFLRRWRNNKKGVSDLSCKDIARPVLRLCDAIERFCQTHFAASSALCLTILCTFTCARVRQNGLHAQELDEVCTAMGHEYFGKALIAPGEGIGVISAESIGESPTQMTFNTFHFAGVAEKNVTLGVPRLQELIETTTNMKKPAMTVYLRGPFKESAGGASLVRHELEYVTLEQLVRQTPIIIRKQRTVSSPSVVVTETWQTLCDKLGQSTTSMKKRKRNVLEPTEDEDDHLRWSTTANELFQTRGDDNDDGYAVHITLHRPSLVMRQLGPNDVAQALRRLLKGRDVHISCSPYNMPKWYVRIDLTHEVENMLRMSNELHESDDSSSAIAPPPTTTNTFVRKKKERQQRRDPRWTPEQLQSFLSTHVVSDLLSHCVLGGFAGLRHVTVAEQTITYEAEAEDGVAHKTECVLFTEGSRLQQVLGLGHLSVDATRTISNDVHEVNNVLGIDAAVNVLFHELRQVLSFDNTYVQDRHIMLAVHTITWHGTLVPMNRHGMHFFDEGFLKPSSFEETYDIISDASAFSQDDPLRSVTSKIMFGQMATFGTGMMDIVKDKNMV